MLSWSQQRKLLYLFGTLAVLFVLIYVPFLLFWHQTPTCSDGIQNGDETGIDCGGSCSQLCRNDAVNPVVLWTRHFRVVPNVYSAVAYLENPNPNSEAPYAEYEFVYYDAEGNELERVPGSTFIPQGKRFAVYEGVVEFKDVEPARVTFNFTKIPSWRDGKFTTSDITVRNKALLREETAPRIEATVFNQSQEYIPEAELVAIIYDSLGKAVAASQTIVEDLRPQETERVTFGWPMPFETSVSVCSSPVDVALLIDRSGSMESDGKDPPEPLTSVKQAAKLFVDQLVEDDRVAVVSFASDTTSHVNGDLSFVKDDVYKAVESINIVASSSSYTNLALGLETVSDIFTKIPSRPDTRRAIILLTDGIPTAQDDEVDPEEAATEIATTLENNGITLYAIGLGTAVNRSFLESLVSDPASYHGAAQSKDLASIYESLATEICAKKPAVIEIVPTLPAEIKF